MASVESTITEEFLTCSICFEIFKDPKTLPCLHSFCKDCIDNLTIKGQTKLNAHPCPICREKFLISKNGAKDLKTNFCLKNLIEFVTSTKEVKKPCSFCSLKGEAIDATSRCLTCNDLLCPECAEHRHRSTTLTLHHQVVSLAEVNAGKYHDEIRSKQQIPCSEHKGEDLKFFCETCDATVCRDCIVLSHQNHKCVTPSDARKLMEKNLKSLLGSLDQKLETLKNTKENVVSSLKKLEVGKKDVKKTLEKEMNAIIKNVMESKIKAEEEFDQLVKSKQDILEKEEKAIEGEKKLLEETLLFCNNILQCGSDIEILSMKTDIKQRLSKLQSSNSTETCCDQNVDLPAIQFCNEERGFMLVAKINENRSKEQREQENRVVPKESVTSKFNESATKKVKEVTKKVQSENFPAKDEHEPKRPNYTSVAWVDEDTIAVVDQKNQKLKRISRKGIVETVAVADCMVVSSFKDGLACKAAGKVMHVFNNSLQLKKTIYEVSTLLTSSLESNEVCWISGLKKICVLQNTTIKEINIHDPHTTSNLSDPMYGHVLQNGMFAVSDWDKDCIFLIRRSGYIERRKYCRSDFSPGSISSDSELNVYVCNYESSIVEVFELTGKTIRIINICAIARNPKSISINKNGQALVANGKSFTLIN